MSDLLVLRTGDDVGVATRDLSPGERVDAGETSVTVADVVPRGHKLALHDVAAGDPVRKYGQVIGAATAPITAGQHVHSHNLAFVDAVRSHELATTHTEPTVPDRPRPTFRGYRRADGRVGTRNYIAVLTSVNYAVASGEMTVSEELEIGVEEFVPWHVGAVT